MAINKVQKYAILANIADMQEDYAQLKKNLFRLSYLFAKLGEQENGC